MRWKMKPYERMGAECLWDRMPIWLRATALAGVALVMSPAVILAVEIGKSCARIGRPWYLC